MMKFFDEIAHEFEIVKVARDALTHIELLIRDAFQNPCVYGVLCVLRIAY